MCCHLSALARLLCQCDKSSEAEKIVGHNSHKQHAGCISAYSIQRTSYLDVLNPFLIY